MVNLQVTAFHIDFSTLDIEAGEKAIIPSGINYTIQPTVIPPMMKWEPMLIEMDKETKGKVGRKIRK